MRNHPCFRIDSAQETIWRYMELAKFASLLQTRRLYLPNPISFDDKLEGTHPEAQLAHQKAISDMLFQKYQVPTRTEGEFLSNLRQQRWAREWMYVSCWHRNEGESAAMWGLYAKSSDALAITTNIETLAKCLGEGVPSPLNSGKTLPVYIGNVTYIDRQTDLIDPGPGSNLFNLIMHKRKSYEHERELRVVIPEEIHEVDPLTAERSRRGISLTVDLNLLIKDVYVAPTSSKMFVEVVQCLLNSAGVFRQPIRSDLESEALV
jgi:hypothetical protein